MNGVLLTAYGSASGVGDIERYLAHILRKPPTPEQSASLRRRYQALGGSTPLHATTQRQAELLRRALGAGWRVEVGMKHTAPFIEDVAAGMKGSVERGVVLPLAAHDSRMSVGGYHEAARRGLGDARWAYVNGFATHPLLLEMWAERVQQGLQRVPGATVLFTAHSLPNRVLGWHDPYPGEVRATCEGVAKRAGLERWELCFQSAAGQDWLGPDVLVALGELQARGVPGVVAAPIGFVADHLETLYDLDIEAAQKARELGLAWARCPCPNDDPRVGKLLADVAHRALASLPA